MEIVSKTLVWLSMLALIASCAAFGLFLGLLGQHLSAAQSKLLAVYFCILQGGFALWLTLNTFVIADNSPALVRANMILAVGFVLATYCGLIYLVHRARRLVAEVAHS